MEALNGLEARERIWSLIKDIKVAMLATWDAETHEAHARPMMALQTETFDGVLWFFTRRTSRKAHEINVSHEALLSYADPKGMNFVSLSGRATLIDDGLKVAELWNDNAAIWFPEGQDDPNLVLLQFEAVKAEFWAAPNAVSRGVSYLKSLVTGKVPDLGTTGEAAMQPHFTAAN